MLALINDYHIYEVPSRFSYQHILLLLLNVVYIFFVVKLLKNRSHKTQKIFLVTINIMCLLLFMGRMFFGWENARIYNDGSKTSLLPLELCNLNIIVSLVALLINKKFLNNYMYFVTMIGGTIPLLVFPDCHMITNGNNLFHYMFVDYWFIHTNLCMIPIAMLSFKWFKPEKKEIPFVILTIIVIYFTVFLVSVVLRNFKYFEGANYMYSMYHNDLPILKQLYSVIPIPFLYGLPLALPVSLLFYLMALPFSNKINRRKKIC